MTDQGQLTDEAPAVSAAEPGSRSVNKNLVALGTGQLFTWTMTLAWTVVVPRLLGPHGMGVIVTGIAISGLLQLVLGAGTGVYVARELVVSPERAGRLVGTAMVARLMLTPLFMAAVLIWAQVAHYSVDGKLVLYLSGAATMVYLLAEPAQSFFQASERMHYRAIADAINKAAQGLAGIALTLLGCGVIGFAACWMVMSGVVLALSLRWVRRYVRLEFRTTRRDLADVARGSVAFWASGVFGMIYLWIDTAMLSTMTNPTVVGWYGVPTKLFQAMLFVPVLFSTAWLPRLVRSAQSSERELHAEARKPVAWVLSLSLPIAAIIGASAPAFIHLVYGSGYAQAVPVLVILGFCLIPMYLNIMLYQVCVAENRQSRWTWLMVAACVFNPALNAVLIPVTQHTFGNGAIGAAIALVATEVVVASGGIAITGRHVLGLSTVGRVARAGLASGGMWLVVYVTRGAGAALSLAAGGAALVALVWLCGVVTRDERRQIRDWLGRRGAKLPLRLTRPRGHQDVPRPDHAIVPARTEQVASATAAEPALGRQSVLSIPLANRRFSARKS